jgi:hypothetical protein
VGFTEKFQVQHNEILVLAKEITQQIQQAAEPAALRKQLSALAGKLSFHLAMEDRALYPRLTEAKDTRLQDMARQFMAEMGGLAGAFAAYNNKWQVSAIKADPAGFAAETQAVFTALKQRIARENTQLYPLAEQAG